MLRLDIDFMDSFRCKLIEESVLCQQAWKFVLLVHVKFATESNLLYLQNGLRLIPENVVVKNLFELTQIALLMNICVSSSLTYIQKC